MSDYSLRNRLLLGVSLWSLLVLALAGFVVVLIFTITVQRDQVEDLGASLDQLTVAFSKDTPSADSALTDPRYQEPGGGLYYQVEDLVSGQTVRSRSLWDTQLQLPAPNGTDLLANGVGPAGQTLSVLVRDITVVSPPRALRLAVAEDVDLRGHSITMFSMQLAAALFCVAAAVVVAAFVMLRVSLAPVAALRRGIAAIHRGSGSKLEGTFPREFDPLVKEVNALLDVNETTLRLARERADDLAHGLKTPLAVMRATADRLRQSGDAANASALDLLSGEMADRIDYQMRLSHLRVRSKTRNFATSIDQALIRSVAVIRKTGRGADLYWHLSADRVDAEIDPHDLMELVGVLLENAGKWASSEVTVSSRRDGDRAQFIISDDGPGLASEDFARVGERGRRLDETRSGSGFGLAIAREICRLNDGTIEFRPSPSDGLEVAISLPSPQTG